jgi:hypothetical protein
MQIVVKEDCQMWVENFECSAIDFSATRGIWTLEMRKKLRRFDVKRGVLNGSSIGV